MYFIALPLVSAPVAAPSRVCRCCRAILDRDRRLDSRDGLFRGHDAPTGGTPVMAAAMRRANGKDLQLLKDILERGPARGS
jgi:hypothetical protein